MKFDRQMIIDGTIRLKVNEHGKSLLFFEDVWIGILDGAEVFFTIESTDELDLLDKADRELLNENSKDINF